MNITSIEELKVISQGEIVELPSFTGDKPFVARLKRPSLLSLAETGVIPNPLLAVAENLFNGKMSEQKNNASNLKDVAQVFSIVAENALVEPTMQDIEGVGLQLTDVQLLTIFNYTQMGVKALSSFRSVKADSTDN